jgi:hypothetical protein
MAITAGETLSLNSLGSATGQTEKSLSAAKGNTTGPIAMSSFGIDEVGSISGFTYAVENTNENYTLGFTGEGSNFSRISSRGANFTWSVPTGTKISLDTNSGETATFAVGNMTDVGTQTTLQGIETHTLRVVFNDGFNDHATNYNTNRDKTVYSVDSYDGNSTALCLTIDSPVTLADGTTIEAGELSEGDKLKGFSIGGLGTDSDATFLYWSSSELSKTEKDVTIVNLTYSFSPRYYDINNSDITATAEHPMLVKDSVSGDYKFKEMFNLVVGDKLIKGDGSEVDIFSIEVVEKTTEIISIDVEEEDTYMVNGYITHNKGGNTHSDFSGPGAPTSVTYSSPLITWVAPSDTTTTGVTAYEYQISSASNFSSIENTEDEWSTTEVEVNTILAAGTWYFRVRAIEAGLKGAWSSTLTFTR